MFRPLVLLSLATVVSAGQPAAPQSSPAPPRPVKEVTKHAKVPDIEFVRFEFQEPRLYHALTVHFGPIEGQPAIAARYGVEAVVGGEGAIRTATFDAIDENGVKIQPIATGLDLSGGSRGTFVGFMTVPAHPFRILLTGESVDGQPFTRIYRPLFKPVKDLPARRQLPPDLPREAAVAFQQTLDMLTRKTIAEREALIAENPTATIVMPRMDVSKVMYAPLLSSAGRPLGLRISYHAQFSQHGRYNPRMHIVAEDDGSGTSANTSMHVLNSTIEPLPLEAHAPHEEARHIPGLLSQRADFVYEGGTVYTFTVDVVPNYISLEKFGTRPCVSHQRFQHERDGAQKAFARMLAREGPTSYRMFIGDWTQFEGTIEGFHGEGTFYRSFIEDGVRDCERQSPYRY